jgi:hypothetical protein
MALMYEQHIGMGKGNDWRVAKVIIDIENDKVKLCWKQTEKKTMKTKTAKKTMKKKAAIKSTKTAAKKTTKKKNKKSAMNKAAK